MTQNVNNAPHPVRLTFKRDQQKSSWWTTFEHSWRSAWKIDYTQVTSGQALWSAIGFVLPLIAGLLTHQEIIGVSLAGGASLLGTVGITYTYRTRSRTLLLACTGIAFSAFIGSITGSTIWLSILVAGIWGFAAGMLVALGSPATVVGLQSTLALIILTHFALPPFQALIQALFMFTGALWQMLIILIFARWRRISPERQAIINLYQTLANYTQQVTDDTVRKQMAEIFVKSSSIIQESITETQPDKIFLDLVEEAERIRLNIHALARLKDYLSLAALETTGEECIQCINNVLEAAHNELSYIAQELQPAHLKDLSLLTRSRHLQHKHHDTWHHHIKRSIHKLKSYQQQKPSTASALEKEALHQTLFFIETLQKQLYQVSKRAKTWQHQKRSYSFHLNFAQKKPLHLLQPLSVLRTNLTLQSSTCRHAIRLGLTLLLATAIYRLLLPLTFERGYWIPLTALIVLKPDFANTFARGVARTLGTTAGAILVTLLISWIAGNHVFLIIITGISAYCAFSLLFANYAIFSIFITMMVISLLTFVLPQTSITAEARALDTLLGGGLALFLYLIWPTWEREQLPVRLADRYEAIRLYYLTIVKAYSHPSQVDRDAIARSRFNVRLARINAQASAARVLQEPRPPQTDTHLLESLLSASDNIVWNILTLEAFIIPQGTAQPLIALQKIVEPIDQAFSIIVEVIRTGENLTIWPELSFLLHALEDLQKIIPVEEQAMRTTLFLFKNETRHIITQLDSIYQLLRLPTST